MTLEELADLIRANSANTNGRIDRMASSLGEVHDRLGRVIGNVLEVHEHIARVMGHVREVHEHVGDMRNETNAALMNLQNDLTDVRGEMSAVRRGLDLVPVVAAMQKQIDALAAEVAEMKRRA